MKSWLYPVLILSLGGALGSNARYWLGRWIASYPWGQSFPLGTLVINVSGSLLFALAAVAFLERSSPHSREWFLLIATGFCGAYTTFSTFEWETLELVRQGKWPLALVYVLASVLAGFAAVVLVAAQLE